MDNSAITTSTTQLHDPSTEIQVVLPTWVGQLTVLGVSFGAALVVLQVAARKWIRYSPFLRRVFPRLFAGQWDEVVDQVATFLHRTDVRFADLPTTALKEALRDPETIATLLTTEARLAKSGQGITIRSENPGKKAIRFGIWSKEKESDGKNAGN